MTDVPAGTIVVGIDACSTSDDALDWAIQEAVDDGYDLTVVHAAGPEIGGWAGVEPGDLRVVIDAMSESGNALLERAAARVAEKASGVEVHRVLRLAGPHRAIMALADGAAMIVLGSRSPGAHHGPLLESAVRSVAAHAPCPVVVPRPMLDGEGDVVVLVDGTTAAPGLLAEGVHRARSTSRGLAVVYCLADPSGARTAAEIELADRTARAAAGRGATLLGFERTVLCDLVRDLRRQVPDVMIQLLVDDATVDDELEHLVSRAAVVIADSDHVRRLSERVFGATVATDVHCVTIIVPVSDIPAVDLERAFAGLPADADPWGLAPAPGVAPGAEPSRALPVAPLEPVGAATTTG